MQIDFHYATTWVVARAAGFNSNDANIIAYACQYVDDAINSGHINFTNGASFERACTAHSKLDYKNLEELKNMQVWLPFHFLPGNGGLPAGQSPKGSFIQKLVCTPGSYVAHDMVAECINDKHRPYALHRLGITSHVFVDTWGHQGLAGVQHQINNANDFKSINDHPIEDQIEEISRFFSDLSQGCALSQGHDQALSNSALPYESWSFVNGLGNVVKRNNPVDFVTAADELCKVFQRFIAGDTSAEVKGLTNPLREAISACFRQFENANSEQRHSGWLNAIADDFFGLGTGVAIYIPKGEGSWKHQALGTIRAIGDDEYTFTPDFMSSNWKYFHDAAKKHRLAIIEDILPKYGICIA